MYSTTRVVKTCLKRISERSDSFFYESDTLVLILEQTGVSVHSDHLVLMRRRVNGNLCEDIIHLYLNTFSHISVFLIVMSLE